MQIKRFQASNVQEALRFVKAEFGGDAVILSTRSMKGKGVEVTAAIDRNEPVDRRAGEPKRGTSQFAREDGNGDGESRRSAELKSPTHLFADSPIHQLPERPADVKNELKELKELIGSLVSHVQKEEFFSNNKTFSMLHKTLISAGVDETLSYKMLQFLSRRLPPEDMKDVQALLGHLRQFIARQISVSGIAGNGRGPKAAIFVGPTGVGKTTTIAKLAAINSMQRKKKTALVTLDTYRIAAAEQLKIYGRIMGIPVHIAGNPEDLARVIEEVRDADLILVDTAGRSQRDKAHMEELGRIYDGGLSLETYLVLSATAKEKDTMDVIRRYKDRRVDRLLFTKLDETTTYGGILNAAIASGKPLSYFAIGQRVPEDIEAARPEKVADLIFLGMRAEG
jgi:flagellar biosynthesis protein FlhF